MLPAARRSDTAACPVHGVTEVQGPGCPRVLIGNQPAARQGDTTSCGEAIVRGCPTVLIGNARAARETDMLAQGGTVLAGFRRVLIGTPPVDARGEPLAVARACMYLWRGLNRTPDDELPHGDLDRYRSPTYISPGSAGSYWFPGDWLPSPTVEHEVTVRGHKIKVVVPVSGPKEGEWLPSAEMIAKGLGTLPDDQLAKIQTVVVCPQFDPNRPEAGACYVPGTVYYFPRPKEMTQGDIDWVLIHEAAHTITSKRWKQDPSLRAEWEQAIKDDGHRPSDYAGNNAGEDFAESVVMYALSKGTACEATARAIYPARYAILDRMVGEGFQVRRRRAP
jgi:uncharacterized Zn-binding protein involved in type VI secretion